MQNVKRRKRLNRIRTAQSTIEYFLILCVLAAAVIGSQFFLRSRSVFDKYFVKAANRISDHAVSPLASPPPPTPLVKLTCAEAQDKATVLTNEMNDLLAAAANFDGVANDLKLQIEQKAEDTQAAKDTAREYTDTADKKAVEISQLQANSPQCFTDPLPADPFNQYLCAGVLNSYTELQAAETEAREQAEKYTQIADDLYAEAEELSQERKDAMTNADTKREEAEVKRVELEDIKRSYPECF
jgi:hypothetical protein